jgi:hypothetical protein
VTPDGDGDAARISAATDADFIARPTRLEFEEMAHPLGLAGRGGWTRQTLPPLTQPRTDGKDDEEDLF